MQTAKDNALNPKAIEANQRIVVVGRRESRIGRFIAENLTILGFEAQFYNEDTSDFWYESHAIYFDSEWDFAMISDLHAETHWASSNGQRRTVRRDRKPTLLVVKYDGEAYQGPWPSHTFSILNLRLDGELFQRHVLALLAEQDSPSAS